MRKASHTACKALPENVAFKALYVTDGMKGFFI